MLVGRREIAEREMFGGLAFLHRGHMCCGVIGDELCVRVGPDGYADALSQPHTREMDFTGRPLRSMGYVSAAGLRTERALAYWVERGVAHTAALPRKTKRPAKKRR